MTPVVLDTCTLLWLAAGSRELSPAAARAIERADEAIVSAISLTEIHRLLRRGQIELPTTQRTLDRWFLRVLDRHRLVCEPITPEIAHRAELLPWHHRDPADRFILATAASRKCPVLSPDDRFHDYPVTTVW